MLRFPLKIHYVMKETSVRQVKGRGLHEGKEPSARKTEPKKTVRVCSVVSCVTERQTGKAKLNIYRKEKRIKQTVRISPATILQIKKKVKGLSPRKVLVVACTGICGGSP